MSFIEKIQLLDTNPYADDDNEYVTCDFIEWFYTNVVKKDIDEIENSILNEVVRSPEYGRMSSLCLYLINKEASKHIDTDTRHNMSETIKEWLIEQFEEKLNDE